MQPRVLQSKGWKHRIQMTRIYQVQRRYTLTFGTAFRSLILEVKAPVFFLRRAAASLAADASRLFFTLLK